jgi:hypothetical protein
MMASFFEGDSYCDGFEFARPSKCCVLILDIFTLAFSAIFLRAKRTMKNDRRMEEDKVIGVSLVWGGMTGPLFSR